MVRKIKNVSECHICGKIRKLTYEHIPQKSAFNNFPQYEINFFDKENSRDDFFLNGRIKGKPMQQGVGKFALCSECNNNTGALYVNSFTDFIKQIHQQLIIQQINVEKGILNEAKYKLFPLQIMKQAIAMFLALNDKLLFSNSETRTILKDFVLEKNNKEFPSNLRLYYYVLSPITTFIRKSKFVSRKDLINNDINIFASEISFLTSGFILTTSDFYNAKNINIKGLVDITFFQTYNYEQEIEFEMELPIYPNNTEIILDFRTREELYNKSILPDGDILLMNNDSLTVNYRHTKKTKK